MRVEVLQARAPVGHKSVGDIIPDMPAGLAGDLQKRGIVRQIVEPVNRMMGTGEPARAYATKKRH